VDSGKKANDKGAFCVALRAVCDLNMWSLSLVWCCKTEKCRKIGANQVMGQLEKVSDTLQANGGPKPQRLAVCLECGKIQQTLHAAFKQCSRCRFARYCSLECQKKAWKKGHKDMCFEAKPPCT
jgi:hypothetical protein